MSGEILLRSWGLSDESGWRVTLDQGDERITIEAASKAQALALAAGFREVMLAHATNYRHEAEPR